MSQSSQDYPGVRFFYEKSRIHRAIHVDGAIGSLTANGILHLALFNERAPIPQQTVQRIVDGVLSDNDDPKERVGKPGVMREVEVSVYISLEAARGLRDFIDRQLIEAEKLWGPL